MSYSFLSILLLSIWRPILVYHRLIKLFKVNWNTSQDFTSAYNEEIFLYCCESFNENKFHSKDKSELSMNSIHSRNFNEIIFMAFLSRTHKEILNIEMSILSL